MDFKEALKTKCFEKYAHLLAENKLTELFKE